MTAHKVKIKVLTWLCSFLDEPDSKFSVVDGRIQSLAVLGLSPHFLDTWPPPSQTAIVYI